MARAEFYVVTESFVGTIDGREVEYHVGEIVGPSEPALRKWPKLFGPLVVRDARIEQATAAPGEKRGA